jgi:uncharacterized protein YdeI (YjbR/CyaY-like superfamily)
MPEEGFEEVRPSSRAAWRAWLARHQGTSRGVWLVWPKRRSGLPGITLEDAMDQALCFGWIDSRLRPIDGEWSALMFTPRRPKSVWSGQNKRRVAALAERGLMTAAGLHAVEWAKKDGSWSALDGVESLRTPDDLARALEAQPAAHRNFQAMSPSAKKGVLWWIESAKRPQTRARRIAETVKLQS